MKKKIQLLNVTIMASIMILLAFSGIAHGAAANDSNLIVNNDSKIMSNGTSGQNVLMNNSVAFLNQQEIHDLQKFMTYNLIHYGVHSNMPDKLQYKADLDFVTWYIGNFSQIPYSHRGITTQNSSIILPVWENESPQAKGDVQAVANYEVSQYTAQNEINTTYIVNNRLGKMVSNETAVYHNQSANLLVYKYTKDNQSLVYELIAQKGTFTPVDPYIRLNAFTIHWGWGGLISGTSYNMYYTFTSYNNALSFKNFLASALTIKASVETAMTDIGWIIAVALAGSIAGPEGTAIGALVGVVADLISLYANTNPTTIASTISGLFTNQEDYNGQFQIVYTLNAWEDGLVPEFSWWGYINPGSILTQIYKDVGLASVSESNFITVYNYMAGMLGSNVQTYFSAPSTWSIATYLITN